MREFWLASCSPEGLEVWDKDPRLSSKNLQFDEIIHVREVIGTDNPSLLKTYAIEPGDWEAATGESLPKGTMFVKAQILSIEKEP